MLASPLAREIELRTSKFYPFEMTDCTHCPTLSLFIPAKKETYEAPGLALRMRQG